MAGSVKAEANEMIELRRTGLEFETRPKGLDRTCVLPMIAKPRA
jgi:hypothetical protein